MSIQHGVSLLRDGGLHRVQPNGLPGVKVGMDLPLPAVTRPVVMVHGFQYDPTHNGKHNPHKTTFENWRRDFVGDRGFGFGWYSVPLTPCNLARAWINLSWNRYNFAWRLAHMTGRMLAGEAQRLQMHGTGFDIVCHSLGSRVALKAIRSGAAPYVRRVLIMNGAEHQPAAKHTARNAQHVEFFNLVVKSDDVLRRAGSWFSPAFGKYPCIGQAGIGKGAPKNWTDIWLDDPVVKRWGQVASWDLAGDKPGQIGDHWYTFNNPGNHGLLKAILEHKEINPPFPNGK